MIEPLLSESVSRTHIAITVETARYVAEVAGVTLNQWRILSALSGGACTTSSEVAALSGLAPSIVSRVAQDLAGRGLLIAERNFADQRTVSLALTPGGQSIFDKSHRRIAAFQEAVLEALTDHEIEVMARGLEKLERAAMRRTFHD